MTTSMGEPGAVNWGIIAFKLCVARAPHRALPALRATVKCLTELVDQCLVGTTDKPHINVAEARQCETFVQVFE
ncbi:MAG: hypothetical protein HQ515_23550 [Phycisphaeraceae bacterium]|nr:hypothetical protein [Phycisphaeraceae bacterium]